MNSLQSILIQDGVTYFQLIHEAGCPAEHEWNKPVCTCAKVRVRLHQGTAEYERDLKNATAMNRKARREAKRAIKKSKKRG